MKKIKKVFVGMWASLLLLASTVLAIDPKYGIYEPPVVNNYSDDNKILWIVKLIIATLSIIMGIYALISKKFSKKQKAIIVAICAILIIVLVLMQYIYNI